MRFWRALPTRWGDSPRPPPLPYHAIAYHLSRRLAVLAFCLRASYHGDSGHGALRAGNAKAGEGNDALMPEGNGP